jgi:hypothetical protein
MALRPPSAYSGSIGLRTAPTNDFGIDPLEHEIAAEKASALGRAGEKAEAALLNLRSLHPDAPEHGEALRMAARAVHAYFIQLELILRHRSHMAATMCPTGGAILDNRWRRA